MEFWLVSLFCYLGHNSWIKSSDRRRGNILYLDLTFFYQPFLLISLSQSCHSCLSMAKHSAGWLIPMSPPPQDGPQEDMLQQPLSEWRHLSQPAGCLSLHLSRQLAGERVGSPRLSRTPPLPQLWLPTTCSVSQGPTCTTDVNECQIYAGTTQGCQNGATCHNTPGSYR